MLRKLLLSTVALFLIATGCGSSTGTAGDKPSVLAAFYPLAYVAERVGGDDVEVTNLTRPGAEAHDLELSPRQVGELTSADLVVYESGFQPAVDDAVEQASPESTLDVSRVVDLAHDDPHVWLDPTRLAKITTATGAELARVDPDHATAYRGRAEKLVGELEMLDAEYAKGLADCERRLIVTSHASFGYLADRYDLTQEAIAGLSPEADPSPGHLADIARLVQREGVTTLFFETLVSPRVVTSLAEDAGARTAVLDPLEGVQDPAKDDYLSVMRDNLTALRTGLGCR